MSAMAPGAAEHPTLALLEGSVYWYGGKQKTGITLPIK